MTLRLRVTYPASGARCPFMDISESQSTSPFLYNIPHLMILFSFIFFPCHFCYWFPNPYFKPRPLSQALHLPSYWGTCPLVRYSRQTDEWSLLLRGWKFNGGQAVDRGFIKRCRGPRWRSFLCIGLVGKALESRHLKRFRSVLTRLIDREGSLPERVSPVHMFWRPLKGFLNISSEQE